MELNAFIGKRAAPTAAELAAALGTAKPVWDQLLAELKKELAVTIREWNSYSPKFGWSLRLKRKSRTVVWLSPIKGSFLVTYILGQKAMQAAGVAKLPQSIVKIMKEAPKYPEGTGVRILMKSVKYLPAIKKLATIKLAY
jgi:hypothetical protein